ncbi:MAG: class I SAM-dependent methyltransferase [Candidatus Eisenbacteria bacterium]
MSAAPDAPEPGSRGAVALEMLKRAALEAPSGRAAVLVDLGCGPGALLAYAPGRFALRVGIDRDAVALRRAPDGCLRIAADLDAASIPLAAGCASACVCLDAIGYLADPRRFLADVARILAPGGIAIVSAPNAQQISRVAGFARGRPIPLSTIEPLYGPGQRHLFTGRALASLFEDAGFTRIERLGLLPAPSGGARAIATRMVRRGPFRSLLAPGVLVAGRKRR